MNLDLVLPLAAIAAFFLLVFCFLGRYFIIMHRSDDKSRQSQDRLLNSRMARNIRTQKNIRKILGDNGRYGEP